MRRIEACSRLATAHGGLVAPVQGAHKVQVVSTYPVTKRVEVTGEVDGHRILPLLVLEVHLENIWACYCKLNMLRLPDCNGSVIHIFWPKVPLPHD